MKKSIGLSAAPFFLAAIVSAQSVPGSLESEIKIDKEAIVNINKEKKGARKELRKLKGNEVSYQAKQAFPVDFGNIPVLNWQRLDNFDEADFMKDGQAMSAFYDNDAKLVGTITNKTFADLPGKAQKYISEKYRNYNIEDVVLFDDNELNESDMILYNVQFNDIDSYFVELKKDNNKIILQVKGNGEVSYFTRLL